MKKILSAALLSLLLVVAVSPAHAQYQEYKTIDGVTFFAKWSHQKWYSKKSPRVLLIKVVNTSSSAVEFDLGVEFFKNLQLVEEKEAQHYCLGAGKTFLPRMAGLVFQPASENEQTIDSFELSGLEITKKKGSTCESR